MRDREKSEILADQYFLNSNGQFMCNVRERERERETAIGFNWFFQTRKFLLIKNPNGQFMCNERERERERAQSVPIVFK